MLAQLGYHLTAEEMGAPWVNIPLKKENSFLDNSTAASQILDWYTEHGFYDCAGVGAVYEKRESGLPVCITIIRETFLL